MARRAESRPATASGSGRPAGETSATRRRGRLWRAAATALTIFTLGALTMMIVGPRIDLSAFRAQIERTASGLLGRRVTIGGEIRLAPRLWPTLEVGELTIADRPPNDATDFASVQRVFLQIELLALLRGDVQIRHLELDDVVVRLERFADGSANWSFGTGRATDPTSLESLVSSSEQALEQVVQLHGVLVRNLDMRFHDESNGRRLELTVHRLAGRAARQEPFALTGAGAVAQHDFLVSLTGGTLDELYLERDPWPFELEVALLETDFMFVTVADNVARIYFFPIPFLVHERLPDDGTEACFEAMRRTRRDGSETDEDVLDPRDER